MNSSPPSRIQRARRRQGALEPFREPVQQLVAAIMAVRVVDLLEVVQIHVTERKGPLRLHRLLQFTEQDTAVGKPRQGIVLRHQLPRFF